MELDINDGKGWTAIRLVAAINQRNADKLQQLSARMIALYTEKEISEIWRKTRVVLVDEQISWLGSTLQHLASEAA